jgi:hypothetical protein
LLTTITPEVNMRPAFLAAVAFLVVACDSAPLETTAPSYAVGNAGRTFSYTTIAVPDALATAPSGINARGDVVGQYVDANFVTRGFLLRQGEFITIDYPGAEGTQLRDINQHGDIVGTYWYPGEPLVNVHSFVLRRDGTFDAADYPNHVNTIAQRILPDGTIVGCRHDHDTMGSMKGIVMSRRGNEEIDAFASMHNGATPGLERIVGLFTNLETGRNEGYVIDGGVFTPFMVPGSNFTAAWDVNPAGEIVGVHRAGIRILGFVWVGDSFLTLDVPGSTATRAFGINPVGDIVGTYVSGGRTYGFLARTGRKPGG